jgi:hypothetical protein
MGIGASKKHVENDCTVKIIDGNKHWYQNGKLHRDGDLPAKEFADGEKHWYQNGKRHRDGDLPAIEDTGGKVWYLNDKIHRDSDLPAIEFSNGTKEWYRNGKFHRDGDLPAIIGAHGTKQWYQNDKIHREGIKPAVEFLNGSKLWYKHDKFYTREQIINYYSQLAYFGRLCLRKIRINRLRRVRWIHGELLCKPPRGNFLGGQDYHKMVSYFTKM